MAIYLPFMPSTKSSKIECQVTAKKAIFFKDNLFEHFLHME